jgi:hypothetical protein
MSTAPLTPQNAQRWARTAGIALLVICSNILLSNDLVTWADPKGTADVLAAHQTWFRIGILGDVIMAGADAVLAVALFQLLRAGAPGLALLGTVGRLINVVLLATGALASLVALDFASDPRTMAALSAEPRIASMQAALDWHSTTMDIGLVFWACGAAIHSVLLWRVRLIPRFLSGAYTAITALLGMTCAAMIAVPVVEKVVNPWLLAPDFLIEIGVALWLTFGALRFDRLGPQPTTSAETPR